MQSTFMRSVSARIAVTAAIGLIVAGAAPASAGTQATWRGASTTSNNWTATSNWTATPTTSGTWSLVYTGTGRSTSNNNVGTVTVDSIDFTNDNTVSKTTNFTVIGSQLRLTNGGTISSTAVTSGTLSDTISAQLFLLGSSTFNQRSNHHLSIGVVLNSGTISKQGAGDLLFTGTGSLGALFINDGVAQFNNTSFSVLPTGSNNLSIGSGTAAGTLRFFGVTSGTTTSAPKLSGNATISGNNGSNITFSSATFNTADAAVGGNVVLTLTGAAGGNAGTMRINGQIQDNAVGRNVGVTVGNGNANLWVLSGSNTYTGNTSVLSDGRLLMDGSVSASSAVSAAGLLAGSGTFGGTVTMTGGTLAPGGTAASGGVLNDSIGKLTVGGLVLSNSTSTQLAISSTSSFDQIFSTGSVTFDGALSLNFQNLAALEIGDKFQLFDGTSFSGNFDTVAASGFYAGAFDNSIAGEWRLDIGGGKTAIFYTDNTHQFHDLFKAGQLVVVPEPSTIVFATIGTGMLGWSSWTGRRAKRRRQLIDGDREAS